MSTDNSSLIDNLPTVNDHLDKGKKRLEVFTSITDSFLDVTKNYKEKELLAFTCKKLAELTNDLPVICLISDNGKNIDNTVAYHKDEIIRNELWNLLETFSIKSKEFSDFLDKYLCSVNFTIPIQINNKIIGTVSLYRIDSVCPFTNDEQTFVQCIANLLASVIRNSRLYVEKEFLLSDIRHRVKNNLQVVSSILSIQSDYIRDIESHKLFLNSLNRIRSMSMIHENLYHVGNSTVVDFERYLKDFVIFLSRTYNINTNLIKININITPIFLSVDNSITCGLIINELISNSIKHAFPDNRSGNVKISFVKSVKQYKLIILDDGIGLPEYINFESNDTFGILLIRTLVDQLNGTLEIIRTKGSKFIIRFPYNSD